MRIGTCLCFILSSSMTAAAQPASLDAVVDRVMTYTGRYGAELATVIADEKYDQRVEEPGVFQGNTSVQTQVRRTSLKAEYALTRVNDGWVGYRDAIEVDGVTLADRAGRLERILASASPARELGAILDDNARFNIYGDIIYRNINIPTLVLQLLQPENRSRFGFSKNGEESINGHRLWRIDYREQLRPTIAHYNGDKDQAMRGTVWVDPATGEIWRTNLMWERGPGGNVQVDYGHVPGIGPLVPLKMQERYKDGNTEVRCTAVYSNFRQFQTGGRLIVP
jgi:hypothetical protein